MGTTAMTEAALISATEKLLTTARKLRQRVAETGSEALEKAYRRTMLYYLEKTLTLEKVNPDYIQQLRKESLGKMHFLKRKLELMEKVWQERFYDQYVEDLIEYELAYDQAVALGWEPPRDALPEARQTCYKESGLCRLAQHQPLTACVYTPSSCRWRVKTQMQVVNP